MNVMSSLCWSQYALVSQGHQDHLRPWCFNPPCRPRGLRDDAGSLAEVSSTAVTRRSALACRTACATSVNVHAGLNGDGR